MSARLKWTPTLEAQLRCLHGGGLLVPEISIIMGASRAAITNRKFRLGLTGPKTPDEKVRILSEMVESGSSRSEVVAALGLTTTTIDYYVRRLGITNSNSRAYVGNTPLDDEIMELESQGLNYAEIGRRVGWKSSQVRCRIVTLERRRQIIEERWADGPASNVTVGNFSPWSANEVAMLRRMTNSGFGAGFIGRNLGRTRAAVIAKRLSIGISIRGKYRTRQLIEVAA